MCPCGHGLFKSNPPVAKGTILCDMKFFAALPLFAATFAAASNFSLERAVDNNDPNMAKTLIEAGVPVDSPITSEGVTALILSAELGKLDMVNYLASAGASLKAVDNFGYTALHFACNRDGSTEGLIACLNIGGAELNAKETEQGNTALHFAAANGSFEKVKALVEAGAEINIQNVIGNTPLMAACIKDNVRIVAYLISKGADFLEVNENDRDALAIASMHNNIGVARVLLRRINPTRKNLNTGIIRALGYAASEEMRALIQEYTPATVSFIARPADI